MGIEIYKIHYYPLEPLAGRNDPPTRPDCRSEYWQGGATDSVDDRRAGAAATFMELPGPPAVKAIGRGAARTRFECYPEKRRQADHLASAVAK